MTLTGINITRNYIDSETETKLVEMTPIQLAAYLNELCNTDRHMTSFVVVAAVKR